MRRLSGLIICIFLAGLLAGQRDTLKKFRLSGVQIEVGPNLFPEFKSQNQADYQKVVKGDPNLQVDLSDYQNQNGFFYHSFEGLLGLKFFLEVNDQKKVKKEIYIGLKYGQEFNTGAYYSKTSYDTTGAFIDLNTNQKWLKISSHESNYNYELNSQKLIIPLGFNFSSNKQNFFWITYGLELAPAFNFGYSFRSSNFNGYEEIILQEGDSINSKNNYQRSSVLNSGGQVEKATKLKGVGFGCSAALPFAMYLHPFKKIYFVKHINVFASITPIAFYTHTKYSGSAFVYTIMLATGIRYNW